MLIDLVTIPKHLRRLDTGLYLQTEWCINAVLPYDWYEYQMQWPEFSGDVDSMLKRTRQITESGNWYPDYGLCDAPTQFRDSEYGKIISKQSYDTCIVFQHMLKCTQNGGMRWHKQGMYVGQHQPQYEYWKDEAGIPELYSFYVYRKK